MRDYYEILGVQKTATANELKKAYRKLAVKYHPDKTDGDKVLEDKFKEIAEAYDVLETEESRKLYDQHGHDWKAVRDGHQHPFASQARGAFQQFAQQQQRARAKGKPVQLVVNLTLEECYEGCEKSIDYTISKTCGGCNGNGAENGTSLHTCSSCGGSGQKIVIQQAGGFNFQSQEPCRACGGVGSNIDVICSDCKGNGNIAETETATIGFPRGVIDGERFAYPGKGHYSKVQGAQRGDVIFMIKELAHDTFERFNSDLVYKHKIGYEDLVIGTTIEVPTIHGKSTKIVVDPGTQNGKIYRLKNHGMPTLNLSQNMKPGYGPDSAFGNYIVELDLYVPSEISEEEIKLIKELKNLKDKNFDKVK